MKPFRSPIRDYYTNSYPNNKFTPSKLCPPIPYQIEIIIIQIIILIIASPLKLKNLVNLIMQILKKIMMKDRIIVHHLIIMINLIHQNKLIKHKIKLLRIKLHKYIKLQKDIIISIQIIILINLMKYILIMKIYLFME